MERRKLVVVSAVYSIFSQQHPRWLTGKESFAEARDTNSIPGLGRSPGEGNGNSLQYSCREHPTDRGAWWATVHGIAKESDMT